MEITSLKIFSHNLESQLKFYRDTLGFCIERVDRESFKINTRENELIFQRTDQSFYYHFAFLIPPNSVGQAIQFVESKRIELLPFQDSKIIEFDSGRAIYFFDMDRNIVEFIERPSLDYAPEKEFGIAQVIKLNEIGLPVDNPIETTNVLIDELGIAPLESSGFRENFCWVGDYHGVVIVVKKGRNWLPTQIPGIVNDFSIQYREAEKEYSFKVQNNQFFVGEF